MDWGVARLLLYSQRLLTTLAIFVITVTHANVNSVTMTKEQISTHVANTWSSPIKGLSGRLIVRFEDLSPGLRHAIFLELRNHSLNPIAVINQPQIHAELIDAAGESVIVSGSAGGAMPSRQWAVMPRDAYLGFRIDMETVGVPTREHGMVLLATGGKSWGLRVGKYVLTIRVVFKNEEDGPANQWVGEIELPSVEVVVAPEMLAM
jgi:hypothetical protein